MFLVLCLTRGDFYQALIVCLHKFRDDPQIVDEELHFAVTGLIIRSPQNRGRVHRSRNRTPVAKREQLPALLRHAEAAPKERLRSGCAQADHDLRLDDLNFCIQPGPAGGDLQRIRLLVNSTLAARLPFEVLHRVGDVGLLAIDTRLDQRLIEQRAGRTDERLAFKSSLSPGCSPDEHHLGMTRYLRQRPSAFRATTGRRPCNPWRRCPKFLQRRTRRDVFRRRACGLRFARHSFNDARLTDGEFRDNDRNCQAIPRRCNLERSRGPQFGRCVRSPCHLDLKSIARTATFSPSGILAVHVRLDPANQPLSPATSAPATRPRSSSAPSSAAASSWFPPR